MPYDFDAYCRANQRGADRTVIRYRTQDGNVLDIIADDGRDPMIQARECAAKQIVVAAWRTPRPILYAAVDALDSI
jgi:hypothetical protein